MAVASESAKFSQVAMSGDNNLGIRLSYKQETKKGDTPTSCRSCGSPKPHKDRKKECLAWKSTCTCDIGHHHKHLCSRKGIPPPPRAVADKEEKKSKEEEHGSVEYNLQVNHMTPDTLPAGGGIVRGGLTSSSSIPDQPRTPENILHFHI